MWGGKLPASGYLSPLSPSNENPRFSWSCLYYISLQILFIVFSSNPTYVGSDKPFLDNLWETSLLFLQLNNRIKDTQEFNHAIIVIEMYTKHSNIQAKEIVTSPPGTHLSRNKNNIIKDKSCVKTSYPSFFKDVRKFLN